MLKTPVTGAPPKVPVTEPPSCVPCHCIVPTEYVVIITTEPSSAARTIGAPHGLKYGGSRSKVGVLTEGAPATVTVVFEPPTRKRGIALLQVVVQPRGMYEAAIMFEIRICP